MKTTTPKDKLSLYDYVESDMEFGPTLDHEKFNKDLEQLILERETAAFERGKVESSKIENWPELQSEITKIRQDERKKVIEKIRKEIIEVADKEFQSFVIDETVGIIISKAIDNLEQEE